MSDSNLSEITLYEVKKSKVARIRLARKGITGDMAKEIVNQVDRDLMCRVLGVDPSTLARYVKRKRLTTAVSETMLDLLTTVELAQSIWEERRGALQRMEEPIVALGNESPIDLMDTFEGRRWVREILHKIEVGDFS
ncbi:DUF2384 domain-containing protein [Natronospirillum operosum]|uniref:DUF2384 domain-containing protein n=1 Tax=Natronospirillum operosum TaxID=2759953 RepID=A0A4Z0WD19_9GAMM|nr:MbcA/ParS/Xre antitoxin family protein [Natronospirillum operosum]TGG92484.1 DUF2384 domain-containing protein [Natronospirillum operosum]